MSSILPRLVRFGRKPSSDKWAAMVVTLRRCVQLVAEFTRHPSRLQNTYVILSIARLFGLRAKPGVLFIGYVEATLGLGQSLRDLIDLIAETNLFFAILPYNRGVGTRIIGPFMPHRYDLEGHYEVNVIYVHATSVSDAIQAIGWKTYHSYNIVRAYWELPKAPLEWADWLEGPTNFGLRMTS